MHSAVIACHDKTIKVLKDGDLHYIAKFDAPVMVISNSGKLSSRQCPIVAYGLRNGSIGLLELTRNEAVTLWSLESSQTNGSPVCAIKASIINPTPAEDEPLTSEVVVARDDGSIEVCSYEENSVVPVLRFETKLEGESITSIDIGAISVPKGEIIVSCYSGKVFCFTPKEAMKSSEPKVSGVAKKEK